MLHVELAHLKEVYANYRKPPDCAESISQWRDSNSGYKKNGSKKVELLTSVIQDATCNKQKVRMHLDDLLHGRVIGRQYCESIHMKYPYCLNSHFKALLMVTRL